jgi:O-methyltransferase
MSASSNRQRGPGTSGCGCATTERAVDQRKRPVRCAHVSDGTDETVGALVRKIGAAGPRPEIEALRTSYLDVLKLCLCDLAGASTREVRSTGDKRWFSRELSGDDQLRGRAEGKDWTLDGLTMIGLLRLDDLQSCVQSVVEDEVEGDMIEAGVWRGGASILIRATLDSLGADNRTLWLADSFEGFPPPEEQGVDADRSLASDLSGIEFLAPGLEAVHSYFARFGCEAGLRFVRGFFEETLAQLRGRRWSLIRLDADTYKATKLALETLYPGLAAGGYLVLDDYFHPWLPECRMAVDEYRDEHGITAPIHQIDWNGGRWCREDEPAGQEPPAPDALEAISGLPCSPPKAPPRIATDRELQLDDQLTAAHARVEALQAEVKALERAPFAGTRAWARAKLRR